MSIADNTPPKVTGHLLLFRNTDWVTDDLSAEEIRGMVDKVNAWFAQLATAGKLAAAQPLMDECVVISGKGGTSVTDGPYSEAKEVVGGYVLLTVETMEEAVAIAKTNPMLECGHTTEVRPAADGCLHTFNALQRLAAASS